MSVELLLLTPVLVLLIFVLFGFTGCGSFGSTGEGGKKYADIVRNMGGFTAHWAMNETSGTTALVHPPALNLNGEYKPGATPGSPGALSKKEPNANFAPALDGTSGYIEVPFSPHLNLASDKRFSVELWVKPAGPLSAGEEQIVISSHHTAPGGNQRGYEIALAGTGAAHATVRGRVFSTNAPTVSTVDVTPTQGDPLAWRHVVLTYDGSGGSVGKKLRVYVSVAGVAGTLSAVTPPNEQALYSPVQAGPGQRPLRVGAGHLQGDGPEKFFAGLLDEVAFYETLLGETDISNHFKAF